MRAKSNPPPQPPLAASVHCMHIHIQQIGRKLKTMNAKILKKKSTIHENMDVTCNFGDGDISRSRSRSHTATPLGRLLLDYQKRHRVLFFL